MGFLARTLITAFAFWCADMLIEGIGFAGPFTLFIAAIVFGIVNALIRPVLMRPEPRPARAFFVFPKGLPT